MPAPIVHPQLPIPSARTHTCAKLTCAESTCAELTCAKPVCAESALDNSHCPGLSPLLWVIGLYPYRERRVSIGSQSSLLRPTAPLVTSDAEFGGNCTQTSPCSDTTMPRHHPAQTPPAQTSSCSDTITLGLALCLDSYMS